MNTRKKKSRHSLDKVMADQPPDRITELERRVLQLERDVALLKGLSGSPFFDEVATEPTRQKPGVKPRLSDKELLKLSRRSDPLARTSLAVAGRTT